MTCADAALYRAKAETRGRAMFFEPEMSARLRERYSLQEDLRSAVNRGELLLHYQPQMNMSGEALDLRRWRAGNVQSAGWSRRVHLFRLRKKAVSLFRWANGFCARLVAKPPRGRNR